MLEPSRLWLALCADNTAFATHCFFSCAEPFRPLVGPNRDPPSSPAIVVQHADAPGLLMARSGRRPAAPRSSEPQRRRRDFLPLGSTPLFLARQPACQSLHRRLRDRSKSSPNTILRRDQRPRRRFAYRPHPCHRTQGRALARSSTRNRRFRFEPVCDQNRSDQMPRTVSSAGRNLRSGPCQSISQ